MAYVSPNPIGLFITLLFQLLIVWGIPLIGFLINTRRNWVYISDSGRVRVRAGAKRSIHEIPVEGGEFKFKRGLLGNYKLTFRNAQGDLVKPRIYLGGGLYFDASLGDELIQRLEELRV